MHHYGVPAENVVIETSKPVFSDEGRSCRRRGAIPRPACRIAIDDFGIGYSNFDRLCAFSRTS